jgi:hypothetical protein
VGEEERRRDEGTGDRAKEVARTACGVEQTRAALVARALGAGLGNFVRSHRMIK